MTTNTYKKENKKLVTQPKQHGQNQSNKKKRNKNRNTVCDQKNTTSLGKTRGERKTPGENILGDQ